MLINLAAKFPWKSNLPPIEKVKYPIVHLFLKYTIYRNLMKNFYVLFAPTSDYCLDCLYCYTPMRCRFWFYNISYDFVWKMILKYLTLHYEVARNFSASLFCNSASSNFFTIYSFIFISLTLRTSSAQILFFRTLL